MQLLAKVRTRQSAKIVAVKWSHAMDILACVTSDGSLSLYRHTGEFIYQVSLKDSFKLPAKLRFSHNSLSLGSQYMLALESGNVSINSSVQNVLAEVALGDVQLKAVRTENGAAVDWRLRDLITVAKFSPLGAVNIVDLYAVNDSKNSVVLMYDDSQNVEVCKVELCDGDRGELKRLDTMLGHYQQLLDYVAAFDDSTQKYVGTMQVVADVIKSVERHYFASGVTDICASLYQQMASGDGGDVLQLYFKSIGGVAGWIKVNAQLEVLVNADVEGVIRSVLGETTRHIVLYFKITQFRHIAPDVAQHLADIEQLFRQVSDRQFSQQQLSRDVTHVVKQCQNFWRQLLLLVALSEAEREQVKQHLTVEPNFGDAMEFLLAGGVVDADGTGAKKMHHELVKFLRTTGMPDIRQVLAFNLQQCVNWNVSAQDVQERVKYSNVTKPRLCVQDSTEWRLAFTDKGGNLVVSDAQQQQQVLRTDAQRMLDYDFQDYDTVVLLVSLAEDDDEKAPTKVVKWSLSDGSQHTLSVLMKTAEVTMKRADTYRMSVGRERGLLCVYGNLTMHLIDLADDDDGEDDYEMAE